MVTWGFIFHWVTSLAQARTGCALSQGGKREPPCLPLHTPAHRKYAGGCPQRLSSVHLCLVAMRVTIACFCFFGSADKMEQNKSNAKLHISWLGKQKPSMTLEILPGFYFSFLQILYSPPLGDFFPLLKKKLWQSICSINFYIVIKVLEKKAGVLCIPGKCSVTELCPTLY